MTTAEGFSAPAAEDGEPETVLQLALDQTSLREASRVMARLGAALARAEAGSPLVLAEGLGAVQRIRRLSRPATIIVADVKICDAGEKIAGSAFSAGADVVTAVAAAIDDVTWRGILAAARDHGLGAAGAAPVILDTIGPGFDPGSLARFAQMASDAGVRADLCIHRPKTGTLSFADLIRPILEREMEFGRLIVAGNLRPAEARAALDAGFGTLIVGGAVASASDPLLAWNAFRAEVAGRNRRLA